MYEHNALGYWSGLALCLTKVRSSRARCPVYRMDKFSEVSLSGLKETGFSNLLFIQKLKYTDNHLREVIS